MSEVDKRIADALGAFGTDFSRWPKERAAYGRRLLVADLGFRAVYENERRLDAALAACRDAELGDPDLAAAATRVRARALASMRRTPLRMLPWRQIAAAMIIASMLGGVADLAFVDDGDMSADLVMLDPLDDSEGAAGE
jgi:hypothetical protein